MQKSLTCCKILGILGILTLYLVPNTAFAGMILQKPPTQNLGLVGYWTMDGGDISGTSLTDKSGNGNTGTITGAVKTIGKIGQALDFNGSSQNVNAGSSSSLNVTGNITITAWIKARSYGGGSKGRIVDRSANTSGYDFQIENSAVSNGLTFIPDAANPVDNITSLANAVSLGKWYFVAVTYDTATAKIYVNGYLNNSKSLSRAIPSIASRDFYIGYRSDGIRSFNGSLDEVRVYNRVLSATEIGKLYNAGSAKIKIVAGKSTKINISQTDRLTEGLVGYWTFDGPDISGTAVTDKSGQGNSGTISGAIKTIGKIGQALNFNGNGDYVSLGTPAVLTSLTYPYAISMWFKTSTLNDGGILFSFDVTDANSDQTIVLSNAAINDQHISSGDKVIDVYPTIRNLSNGNWHHLVVERDSANATIMYVDGRNFSTSDTSGYSVNGLVIGARGTGTYPFNGSIDDVRIYNRALSADEISQLYNMGK